MPTEIHGHQSQVKPFKRFKIHFIYDCFSPSIYFDSDLKKDLDRCFTSPFLVVFIVLGYGHGFWIASNDTRLQEHSFEGSVDCFPLQDILLLCDCF